MKPKPKLITSVDNALQLPSATPACLHDFQTYLNHYTDQGLDGILPARQKIKKRIQAMLAKLPSAKTPEIKHVTKAVKHLSKVNILHKLKTVQNSITERIEQIQTDPEQYFNEKAIAEEKPHDLPPETEQALINAVKAQDTEQIKKLIRPHLTSQINEHSDEQMRVQTSTHPNELPPAQKPISFLLSLYEIYFENDYLLNTIVELSVFHKASDDLITAIESCQNPAIRKKVCAKFAEYIIENPRQCGPAHIDTAIHLLGETGHNKTDLQTLCTLISTSGSAKLYDAIAPLLQNNITDTNIFAIFADLTSKFGDESQQKDLIKTIESALESKKITSNAGIIRVYSLLKRKYQKKSEKDAHKILGLLRPLTNNHPETLIEYAIQANYAGNQEFFTDAIKKLASTGTPEHLLTMANLIIQLKRDDFYDIAIANLMRNLHQGVEFVTAFAKIVLQSRYHKQLRQTAIFNLKKHEINSPKVKKLIKALENPQEEENDTLLRENLITRLKEKLTKTNEIPLMAQYRTANTVNNTPETTTVQQEPKKPTKKIFRKPKLHKSNPRNISSSQKNLRT